MGSTRWASQTTRPRLPVMSVIAYGDDKRWSRPKNRAFDRAGADARTVAELSVGLCAQPERSRLSRWALSA